MGTKTGCGEISSREEGRSAEGRYEEGSGEEDGGEEDGPGCCTELRGNWRSVSVGAGGSPLVGNIPPGGLLVYLGSFSRSSLGGEINSVDTAIPNKPCSKRVGLSDSAKTTYLRKA